MGVSRGAGEGAGGEIMGHGAHFGMQCLHKGVDPSPAGLSSGALHPRHERRTCRYLMVMMYMFDGRDEVRQRQRGASITHGFEKKGVHGRHMDLRRRGSLEDTAKKLSKRYFLGRDRCIHTSANLMMRSYLGEPHDAPRCNSGCGHDDGPGVIPCV